MKKCLFFATMLFAGLTFTACGDDDPVSSGGGTSPGSGTTPTTPKCDIVYMYYGIGGGNLDDSTEDAFVAIVKEQEKHPNVRTFIQFKYSAKRHPNFSSNYDVSGDYGCAYRFEANANTLNAKYDTTEAQEKPFLLTADMKVGDATYKMFDPENLVSFMKWCRDQVPDAKVYVLSFGDHGGAYNITTDYDKSKAGMRGVMYDDNIDGTPCMSPTEIATAIKSVNKKIDLLFFDCCLMSNLEVLGEIQGHLHNHVD